MAVQEGRNLSQRPGWGGGGVVAGSSLAEGAWRERYREQSHWFNNEWQGIPEYGDLSQTIL